MVIPNKANSKVVVSRSHIFKAESLSNELLELLDLFFRWGEKKEIVHVEHNKSVRTRSFENADIVREQVKAVLLCPFNCTAVPEKRGLTKAVKSLSKPTSKPFPRGRFLRISGWLLYVDNLVPD